MSINKKLGMFAICLSLGGLQACLSDSDEDSSNTNLSSGAIVSSSSIMVADTNTIHLTTTEQQVKRSERVTLQLEYDAACVAGTLVITGGEYKSSCTIYTTYGFSTDYNPRSYTGFQSSISYRGYCYFYCE